MICFAKSNGKLHDWFIHSRLYQNNLQSYVEQRAMRVRSKITLLTGMTALMALGFLLMGRVPVGRIVLAVVWLLHMIYFIFGVRTLKTEKKGPDSDGPV